MEPTVHGVPCGGASATVHGICGTGACRSREGHRRGRSDRAHLIHGVMAWVTSSSRREGEPVAGRARYGRRAPTALPRRCVRSRWLVWIDLACAFAWS